MSFLKRMFGGGGDNTTPVPKPRTPPSEPHQSTEEKLNAQIATLEKREDVLEKKVRDEMKKAKEWKDKNNNARALQCLKRKKMYEGEIQKIQAQCMNLMSLQMAQENNNRQNDMLRLQKEQVSNLKKNQMKVEDVENLKEELEDAMQNQQEIDQLLSEPLAGPAADLDEDELLAELDDWAQEQEDEKFKEALDGAAVPTPNHPMPEVAGKTKAQEEEDAMLAEMEAEMMA